MCPGGAPCVEVKSHSLDMIDEISYVQLSRCIENSSLFPSRDLVDMGDDAAGGVAQVMIFNYFLFAGHKKSKQVPMQGPVLNK